MSTEAAPAARPKALLDIDFHESTHSRQLRKFMSTRNLATSRYDDLLRSGSTHQLLNRSGTSPSGGLAPTPESLKLNFPGPSAAGLPPGAPSLKTAEETAEESDSEGSEVSGNSFEDAPDDCAADRDYIENNLGASLHDDELALENVGEDKEADDLIAGLKDRMKLEEGKDAQAS